MLTAGLCLCTYVQCAGRAIIKEMLRISFCMYKRRTIYTNINIYRYIYIHYTGTRKRDVISGLSIYTYMRLLLFNETYARTEKYKSRAYSFARNNNLLYQSKA